MQTRLSVHKAAVPEQMLVTQAHDVSLTAVRLAAVSWSSRARECREFVSSDASKSDNVPYTHTHITLHASHLLEAGGLLFEPVLLFPLELFRFGQAVWHVGQGELLPATRSSRLACALPLHLPRARQQKTAVGTPPRWTFGLRQWAVDGCSCAHQNIEGPGVEQQDGARAERECCSVHLLHLREPVWHVGHSW